MHMSGVILHNNIYNNVSQSRYSKIIHVAIIIHSSITIMVGVANTQDNLLHTMKLYHMDEKESTHLRRVKNCLLLLQLHFSLN